MTHAAPTKRALVLGEPPLAEVEGFVSATTTLRTYSQRATLCGESNPEDCLMKMMIEWATRPGLGYTNDLANRETLLRTFSKWAPPEGLTIHAFVAKLEAQAGYILVECDDPKLLASFQLQFMPWNDVKIVPVLDIEDAVPLYAPALEWSRTAAEG